MPVVTLITLQMSGYVSVTVNKKFSVTMHYKISFGFQYQWWIKKKRGGGFKLGMFSIESK